MLENDKGILKQFQNIEKDELVTLSPHSVSITESLASSQEKWKKLLEVNNNSKIADFTAKSASITEVLANSQKKWKGVLEVNNINKIAEFTPHSVGVTESLASSQEKWKKLLEVNNNSKIADFTAKSASITEVLANSQKKWKRVLEVNNVNKIVEFTAKSASITEVLASSQEKWKKLLEVNNNSKIADFTAKSASITEVLANSQKKWKRVLEVNNINKIVEFTAKSASITEVLASSQEKWKKLFEVNDDSTIAEFTICSARLAESIVKSQEGLANKLRDIDLNKMQINGSGVINYSDEMFFIDDDINATIDEVNLCVNSNSSWEEKTAEFLHNIKSKHPLISFLIIYILINPIYEYYIDCAKTLIDITMQDVQDKYKVSSDKNKVMKDVKREVVKEININSSEDINIKEALRQHKLVKADYLNVRISNSTDSRVLFVLQFGQVVRIVNKNKEWTLIEYSDNKNVYIKGWVYTKYLSSFY